MKKFFSLIAAVLFAGSMMATEVTVSKTIEELATANSWANGTVVTPFALDDVITGSTNATDANTGKYYTSGQQVRLYQSGAAELIISAAEGYTISSITLTYVSQNTGIFVEAESGVAVDFENVQSATFTVGNSGEATNGQARVTSISVTYDDGGEVPPTPQPETIPTTAPAVPAQEEANVMGIYCNHYATNNAHFGISGWAGGYQTLDLDGTMAAYWTGMTWECIIDPVNTDAAHDFSAYENIHVDMWAPAAAKIKFTAEAVAGGNYKDGQVLDLVQGWNSFDIALANWAGNYDFANLKCFCLEQYQTPAGESFEGNPFAIANIYFWNTPALADPTNCAEAREAALSVSGNNVYYKDSTVYTIEGYVTAIQTAYSDTYHNISFWMADAADGGNVIEAYRAACASAEAAPVVGDKVAVTGALTKYGTTPEFGAGCTFVITEHAAPGEDPVNLGPKTIAEFLELANMKDTCILTGIIDSVVNTQYGNFNLVDATGKVYVYGLLTAAGESKKCYEEENLAAGDTLTIKAIYNLYNNKPQVKNAIFVEVKHVPVIPVEGDTIVIDIESGVAYTDAVATQGWWQFMAENEDYEISLSNNYTTQAAGVYTIADMDASYTYVYVKATETEVGFVDGQFTLTEGADGSRTIVGLVTGEDGNIYDIKLVFRIPTPETTVNVEIPMWGVADASQYYSITGYIFYGTAADSTYVQITIPGNNPIGTFTEDDCYMGATGIEVGGDYQSIYSINVTVELTAESRPIITADILCLNNTLYHVTTPYGEGFESVEAAVKAVKKLINGNVVIEKAGVRYSINGQVIR